MVGLRPGLWLDVAQFQRRLAECQNHEHPAGEFCPACLDLLVEAVELYRDDFLSGFTLSDCPDFDEWQFFQADSLHQGLASALERLVRGYSAQGDYETAMPYARRWLSLDPLHEPAQRRLMQLYAQTGQQAAALRQYQLCVQTLDHELAVPPSAKTTALYEQIRTGVMKPDRPISPTPWPTTSAPPKRVVSGPNLPPQPTPFVGRVNELAQIAKRLDDPACRLLTLVGPGGIGKTRLAIQAAQNVVEAAPEQTSFTHGVYFVPLVSLSSPDHLVPTIAEALDFSFYSDVDPKTQLLNYLREKEMLLVLDNFEHLLTPPSSPPVEGDIGGVSLVMGILAIAPAVKILATSREALNLQEEWFYPVEGMAFPEPPPSWEEVEEYSAVQLFVQSARRVHPGFSLAAEQGCVVQICRLVEGMPLGIELAAAWLKMFSCDKIAREIERSLDFLTTTLRDVPPRHRSMRAIFDHSWRLLSESEREVLRRLTIFRGGFRQQAAEQVAGACLPALASLIERSLLRSTPAGRYQMHELLRQFAAEKLQAMPQEKEKSQDRHSDYYLAFLQQQEEVLQGKQQQTALAEIREEIENVRAAWYWAIEQDKVDNLDRALDCLYDFYQIRSRYQEGQQAFAAAATHLRSVGRDAKSESILGRVLARQGAFLSFLGSQEAARELLQQSLELGC